MNYYNSYGLYDDSFSFYALQNVGIASGIGLLVGLVGAILLFALFLKKSNENKFKGFAGWLYQFLNFKKISVEAIIKILYLFMALWITCTSFGFIASGEFGSFLSLLLVGNVVLRICFEFMMMSVSIWKNTSEINQKMDIVVAKKDEDNTPAPVAEDPAVTYSAPAVEEVAAEEVKVEEPTTVTCPACGATFDGDTSFCGKCGAKLK